MRKLKILKALIDLFFFFSILTLIVVAIILPMWFSDKEHIDIPIVLSGHKFLLSSSGILNINSDMSFKAILPFLFTAYLAFVRGIFQLRKLLSLFEKRIIFEIETIKLLKAIGVDFLLASLGTAVPLFLFNVINRAHVDLDFSSGFSSFLFTLSLGLFFMVLSEVFNIAKNMKEENELTV